MINYVILNASFWSHETQMLSNAKSLFQVPSKSSAGLQRESIVGVCELIFLSSPPVADCSEAER